MMLKMRIGKPSGQFKAKHWSRPWLVARRQLAPVHMMIIWYCNMLQAAGELVTKVVAMWANFAFWQTLPYFYDAAALAAPYCQPELSSRRVLAVWFV